MTTICEATFEDEDPNNLGYSLTEFDLAAKLNLSMRKNFNTNKYEIFDLATSNAVFEGSLAKAVTEANHLEDANNIVFLTCRECQRPKFTENVPDSLELN